MNATFKASPRRRSPAMAYPFLACMIKLAVGVVGTVLLFASGIYLGHFATTAWPGPGHWLGSEQPVDTAVLDKLKVELRLSPAQMAQVAPVITEACANLRMISEEHRAERLAVMDEVCTTISQDLSAEQQRQLAALEVELQKKAPVKRDMRIVALF
jgi:hypothetical protein